MADEAHKATDKKLAALERKVKAVYTQAQKDLQAKMDDFTEKSKARDKVYQKKLKDGEISEDQYRNWLAGQVFQGKQWQAKVDQMTRSLSNYNQIALGIINGELDGVFAYNANWQSYSLEHGAGLDFGFQVYDRHTVAMLLRDEPQLLPKKKLNIPKDQVWNQKKITQQILQGVLQGERLDQIAARMRDVASMNENISLTNARTAMTGAQNAGRQESLNRATEMGIKVKKEWVATLDGHTRHQHATLDGQKVETNKPFHYQGYRLMYPGDPHAHPSMVYNCRCTMVGSLEEYPSDAAQRYDNIDGKPIRDMSYKQWLKAKKKGEDLTAATNKKIYIDPIQSAIGTAKTIEDVNNILNSNGWFRFRKGNPNSRMHSLQKDWQSMADLSGCSLECAKSIASTYQRVFDRFPVLKGKLDAVDAHPVDMDRYTYAWCYTRMHGQVQVNPSMYSDYNKLVKMYEQDVLSGWHPAGTTAESIVTHEIGHAVDGFIARSGVYGGYSASGEFRLASSLLRNKVMKACGKTVLDVKYEVSRYAAKNPQEWFAECFAEYMTSANPRPVAAEFGKQLEALMEKIVKEENK